MYGCTNFINNTESNGIFHFSFSFVNISYCHNITCIKGKKFSVKFLKWSCALNLAMSVLAVCLILLPGLINQTDQALVNDPSINCTENGAQQGTAFFIRGASLWPFPFSIWLLRLFYVLAYERMSAYIGVERGGGDGPSPSPPPLGQFIKDFTKR